MPDMQKHKELQYATNVDRGIDCPVCHQKIKWTIVFHPKEVGVCACPWTGWFVDHRGEVYRWRPLTE